MKLYGATMLRNEADIVESFVRHNLRVLDGLVVVDHGSIDGTSEILAALIAEGLPLEVERDASLEYLQSEIMSRTVRHAFARGTADFVIALDADEFLKLHSRSLLEQVLAGLPPGLHALVQWQTYVPRFDGRTGRDPLALAKRRLVTERHGLYKAMVARTFADDPQAVIAGGNHLVLPSADHSPEANPVRHAKLAAEVVALAHLPVRSGRQLANKIFIGWLAHCAARRTNRDLAFHWRELYDELSRGNGPTAERLTVIAANYGLPKGAWLPLEQIALVDDPLPGAEVRYSHLAHDETLPLVLDFAARLAAGR